VRAWRSLDRFELGRPFGPWVCRIAANLAVNHVRSPRAREQGLPEGHAETPSADPGPLGAVLAAEAQRVLGEAMAGLGPEQRAVFVLRVVEEMSYEEIAGALGISPGTVMSRLFRARSAWRGPRPLPRGGRPAGGSRERPRAERLSAYLDRELPRTGGPRSRLTSPVRSAALLAGSRRGRGRRRSRRGAGGYFRTSPPACRPSQARSPCPRARSGRGPRGALLAVVTPLTLRQLRPWPARRPDGLAARQPGEGGAGRRKSPAAWPAPAVPGGGPPEKAGR
jgi:RNA polymerase sigma-70 factor (ECF subfamily)